MNTESAVTAAAALNAVSALTTVKPCALVDLASGKKIAAEAVVKYKIPDAHWVSAKGPALVTVALPAVIVQVPAPIEVILKVSPAVNSAVFTVIVVAPAAFIVMCVPASAACRTYDAVFGLTVQL